MSKLVKDLITAELQGRYADTNSACVVDLTGLNVDAQQRLRRRLREKSARLEVVKNSLARRAFAGGALEPLGRVLEGPCALVTTSQSLIDTAKVLVGAAREFTRLRLKQAIFDGDPSLMTVEELARMKSRGELIGEVAMLLMSPARMLAAAVASPQSKIAGCLQTLAERDVDTGPAPAPQGAQTANE